MRCGFENSSDERQFRFKQICIRIKRNPPVHCLWMIETALCIEQTHHLFPFFGVLSFDLLDSCLDLNFAFLHKWTGADKANCTGSLQLFPFSAVERELKPHFGDLLMSPLLYSGSDSFAATSDTSAGKASYTGSLWQHQRKDLGNDGKKDREKGRREREKWMGDRWRKV